MGSNWGNGKENGNYRGFWVHIGERLLFYWGYIGRMDNEMETSIEGFGPT